MAVDWQNYKKVMLPDIPNLHKIDVYSQNGGYEQIRKVLTAEEWKDTKKLIDYVKSANIRGRGGAGFNAGLKWSFMPPKKEGLPRYLACNGDESEPGTFKDRRLFEFNPHLFIEGVLIACYAMEMDAAYIYIRGEYNDYIKIMQVAVDEAYSKGYIGKNIMGTHFSTEIYLHRGAGAYICGEETSLMESLEGKRAYPRSKPPFPAQSGLWSKPTTINNIDTLACVTIAMRHGADWFAKTGAPDHPGPFLYGISGHVNKPGVYEYPSGMLITDMIYKVCGGVRNNRKIKAIVPGGVSVPPFRGDMLEGVTLNANGLGLIGAMVGEEFHNLQSTIVQNILADPKQKGVFTAGFALPGPNGKEIRKVHSFVGTAGMLVLDETTDMVKFLHRVTKFYHHESCGQCTPCREGCGWLEKLIGKFAHGEGGVKDFDLLLDLCDNMEGRTVCALADAAAWPVRNTILRFRPDFEARIKKTAMVTV